MSIKEKIVSTKTDLSLCQYIVVYDHEYTQLSGWENDPSYNSASAKSRVPTVEGFKAKDELISWIEANEMAHKFGYGNRSKVFKAFEIKPLKVQTKINVDLDVKIGE